MQKTRTKSAPIKMNLLVLLVTSKFLESATQVAASPPTVVKKETMYPSPDH